MDNTESARRQLVEEINQKPKDREELEELYGTVWNTSEVTQEFDIQCFMAPFVVARRRSDGKLGSLQFQHYPRFYFAWKETE